MNQLTLVALYGEKEELFRSFILECQGMLQRLVGASFRPYEPAQVHATIIGMESLPESPAVNAKFQSLRQQQVTMDIPGFLAFLRTSSLLPFRVRIGGFAPRDYSFTSRGQRPFVRSFGIGGGKPVVIGWPTDCGNGENSPPTLDLLRRAAQQFGILHSYHAHPNDVDNDFFFRLGVIPLEDVNPQLVLEAEAQMRRLLSDRVPLHLTIASADLRLARYLDDRLPPASTEARRIDSPEENLGLPG